MKGSQRIIDGQQFVLAQGWYPFCDELVPDLALAQLCQILQTILRTQLANQLRELLTVTQHCSAFHGVHSTTNGQRDGDDLRKLCHCANEIAHEGAW